MSSSKAKSGPYGPLGAQGPDRLITQPNRYADEGHLPLRAILQRTGAAQEMRLAGDGGYNNGLARLDNTARDPLAPNGISHAPAHRRRGRSPREPKSQTSRRFRTVTVAQSTPR